MDDAEINVAPVDRYTSAHAGMGLLLARLGLPWWAALGTSVTWEFIENAIKRARPELFPYSSVDSWQNSATDTLAVMIGYAATYFAISEGLSDRGAAAIDAGAGSFVGGVVGSTVFGITSPLGVEDRTSRALVGYRVGTAVGGAAGTTLGGHGLVAAGVSGLGGAAAGPVGAAVGSYIAAGVLQEPAPNPEHAEPYQVYQSEEYQEYEEA